MGTAVAMAAWSGKRGMLEGGRESRKESGRERGREGGWEGERGKKELKF